MIIGELLKVVTPGSIAPVIPLLPFGNSEPYTNKLLLAAPVIIPAGIAAAVVSYNSQS